LLKEDMYTKLCLTFVEIFTLRRGRRGGNSEGLKKEETRNERQTDKLQLREEEEKQKKKQRKQLILSLVHYACTVAVAVAVPPALTAALPTKPIL
jgi:hypothetical protein